MGRLVFLAGLAGWGWASLRMLPYGYHDLHYLFSVEWGSWGPHEWMHPLFVPLLGACRSLLWFFEHSGKMLMPLESINVAAGALTLSLLYGAAERLGWDPLTAALGVLCLGFSSGFWEGALRPDPYSLGALCSAAALVLLMGRSPGDEGERYSYAGIAAGLTIGFHASGLALVPVAAGAAWLDAGATRRGVRLLGNFLARTLATAALCYAVFVVYKGIGPEYFRHTSFSEMFHKVEQMPGSSIYSSGDLVRQARDYAHSLYVADAGHLALLAGAFLAGALLLGRGKFSGSGLQRRGVLLAAANFIFYALFFLINNSQNGFIYAGLLSAPFVLAFLVSDRPWLRVLFVPAALAVLGLGRRHGLTNGPAQDNILVEARFLDGLLGPGDLLVAPGCPFPELLYERHFNVLRSGDPGRASGDCLVPTVPRKDLPARISETLERGRRVFIPGHDPIGGAGGLARDAGGAEKRRRVFSTFGSGGGDALEAQREFAAFLDEDFSSHCGVRSPQGWTYCRLALRPGRPGAGGRSPAGGESSAPPGSPWGPRGRRAEALKGVGVEEVRALNANLASAGADPFVRMKIDYLMSWLEESPEDPFVKYDLFSTFFYNRSRSRFEEAPEAAMARFVEDLERMGRAVDELERSCSELGKGREKSALEHRRRALSICSICVRRGLAGPPSDSAPAEGVEALRADCRRFPRLNLSVWWHFGRVQEAVKLVDRGVDLFKAGSPEQAKAAFREALDFDPRNFAAGLSLGAALHKGGGKGEALAAYDRMLALKPRGDILADIHAARANTLAALGRKAEARRALSEAVKAASPAWPQFSEAKASLGRR